MSLGVYLEQCLSLRVARVSAVYERGCTVYTWVRSLRFILRDGSSLFATDRQDNLDTQQLKLAHVVMY